MQSPTVANELRSNSKSGLLYWTKRSAFNKIFEKGHAYHAIWKHLELNFVTKLCAKFNNIEDPVREPYKRDVVYYANWPEPSYVEVYTGETSRRLNDRVTDHNGETKFDIFINSRKKVILVLYCVTLTWLAEIFEIKSLK